MRALHGGSTATAGLLSAGPSSAGGTHEEPRTHSGRTRFREAATVLLHSLSAPKGATRLLQEALKKPWNN